MPTTPLNIVGPTGPCRSGQNSPQTTVNFFIQSSAGGKSDLILLPTPGQKPFVTRSGRNRGGIEYLDELYQVSGSSLISVNSSGIVTTRGTIPGSGRCIFAPIRDDALGDIGLIISTDGLRYYYDQSTVTAITDIDLTTGNSVAVMNNVAIFDNLDDVITHTTAGEPTNVNAFYAEANTFTDLLKRVYVHGQLLYTMGARSIEPWAYNGATTEFIFTRQEQATIRIGLGAVYSVASDRDYVYFLGSDKQIYRLRSAFVEPISSPEIVNHIEGFSTYDDCEGFTYQQDGQYFYQINFPAESKSFLFNCNNSTWTQVSSGVDGGRSTVDDVVSVFGKNYALEYNTGNIFELDKDTYSDNGSTILRERTTAVVHGGLFGAPGKRVFFNSLELMCEVGVGLVSGQGSDPVVMMSYSDDGGKTWSSDLFGYMGPLGGYHYRVIWYGLGSSYNRVFRFRVSDPVFVSLHSAAMDVELGI